MASPTATGTSTPSTGLINATMPLPRPVGASADNCSPWPWLCRPPQRSMEGQLEEMRFFLERLADGQTRVEALLRERGARDLSGATKNMILNHHSVVIEPVENGTPTRTSKALSPASDRIEQRVAQALEHWQHKVAADVSEKIISNISSSIPCRPAGSPRGKRARQSQDSRRKSGGDADPPTGNKKSQKAMDEDVMANMEQLQQQMAEYKTAGYREELLKKRKSKDAAQHENGEDLHVAPTPSSDPYHESNPCIRYIAMIVRHPAFDGLCALMIILNSVLIGVSVEETVKHGKEAKWMELTAHVCNSFFLLELIMRMSILGKRYFLSESWTWNTFDFMLVMFSIADVIMTATMGTGASSVGSGMKTIKMLRIVRIFRVFRFFRELSLLALMIADSIKSLCWALLMLTIIIYVFAICFTQSCSDFKWANQDEAMTEEELLVMEDVRTQFGSLPKTIYFLVLSMLGGISWGEVSDTLFSVDALSASLFLFYIFFCLLAVLNIITGVFVDNAVETARTQRDYLASKERQIREKYVADMQNFFIKMDEDGTGTVTLQEMSKYFTDERTRNMFAALGIDPDDMERLFLLLDDNRSGAIDVNEFLEGCLRLKGEAKSIDVHTCLAVTRRILRRLGNIFPDDVADPELLL